jgi:hypothetical protein
MWWGDFKLSPHEGGIWRIGPLRLWIFHDENEWRLGHEHSSDPLDDALELQGTMRRMPVEDFDINRFASNSKSETIQLVPRVADRPVVSQPDNPFHVMPGNEICVYLSTPIWIQVRTDNETLVDIPSFRPSDTWFGADTISGELCYTSITMVRLNQNILPRRCNRALTCLHIKNHASDPLVLDHLKLPVPNLSLYTDSRAQLWTQSLRVERDEDGAMAQIRLEPHPPPELGETELVSEARTPMEENVFARAMNALMSHSKESKS